MAAKIHQTITGVGQPTAVIDANQGPFLVETSGVTAANSIKSQKSTNNGVTWTDVSTYITDIVRVTITPGVDESYRFIAVSMQANKQVRIKATRESQPQPVIPVLASYLGQVGGQIKKFKSFNSGANQMMLRTPHWVRAGCVNPVFRFANWYVNAVPPFDELAPGGIATVSASVEYPIGVTSTPITWGGGNLTHAIADGALGAESDPCPVTIPLGGKCMIRTYYTNPAGVIYMTGVSDATNLAQCRTATTGLADQTAGVGVLTGGAANLGIAYHPLIFAAQTTRPSVLILGDSRAEGTQTGEGFIGDSSDKGNVPRCVGPYFGYADMSIAGDLSTDFLLTPTKRLELLPYFSHVVCEYGVNGVTTAGTGAAEYARVVAIKALLGGKKCFQCTLEPWTTSSDGWTTLAGQAVNAGKDGRDDFNVLVRANSGGFWGTIDFCATAEAPGKLWVVDGGVPTTDGVHPSQYLDLLYVATGVLNPAAFT